MEGRSSIEEVKEKFQKFLEALATSPDLLQLDLSDLIIPMFREGIVSRADYETIKKAKSIEEKQVVSDLVRSTIRLPKSHPSGSTI